ncbi:MAG: hypothetical protein UIC64_05750 [Agathobacter sp.]|nr:hypothetical protein [Agathobacter sp.]
MGENGLSASDVAVLSGNYGRSNDGGMFGGNGDWGAWIILFLIFGLFGNGRGFGGFGGGNGGSCGLPCATQADVRAAVDQQTLISKLDQQTYGLADSTYALNNTITSGFHGVDNAICNLGYNVQSGFNTLGHQISDCCCQTQRAIDGVNYNMATQACDTRNVIQSSTRDILESNNANTRAILDFLTQDKIATLTAENQSLKFQASQTAQNAFITANQEAQTAELIRRLGADCPVPAYVVQPPVQVSFPTNCCGQFSGYNNGCGCGNF